MEKDIKLSLLLDFYGSLLSKKQAQAIELYYNSDLSLSEVADELSITRQGARDLISRGCSSLYEYEASLGLMARFNEFRRGLEQIKQKSEIISNTSQEADICALAKEITDTAARLAESNV